MGGMTPDRRITVLVKPGAHRDAVEPQPDGTVIVRTRARAEAGKANEAVRDLLAGHFNVARAAVRVLTPKARRKIVAIEP